MLKEMTHFFAIYKDLEGKRVEVKGWHDAAYARTKVVEAVNRFKENKVSFRSWRKPLAEIAGGELRDIIRAGQPGEMAEWLKAAVC